MQAGPLDQRITVWRRSVTGQNTFGEDDTGQIEVCSAWASVKYLEGRELERAMQIQAEARYEITMRRRPSVEIRREDWITWRGQTLDVVDVRGQGTREDAWVVLAKDHVE
jgi:SPP1 family predicted phage head-tail adaptor